MHEANEYEGVIWLTQGDASKAKPHQWYYHRKPCVVLAIGLRDNKLAVHRLQEIASREVHDVLWENGELPGVEYELFDHEPGRA